METVILGKKVRLRPRQKAGLKGFTIGEKIAYRFFDGEYQGVSLLFVKPKGDNPTPREWDNRIAVSVHPSPRPHL